MFSEFLRILFVPKIISLLFLTLGVSLWTLNQFAMLVKLEVRSYWRLIGSDEELVLIWFDTMTDHHVPTTAYLVWESPACKHAACKKNLPHDEMHKIGERTGVKSYNRQRKLLLYCTGNTTDWLSSQAHFGWVTYAHRNWGQRSSSGQLCSVRNRPILPQREKKCGMYKPGFLTLEGGLFFFSFFFSVIWGW